MKLFIIPSWYPTKLHPESGSFFQDQAILLDQMETEVYLLTSIQHSFKDIFYYKEIEGNTYEKYKSLSIYRNETINIFPKFEKLAFYRFQKHLLNHFSEIEEKIGKPDLVFFHSSLWAGSALSEHLHNNQIPFIVAEHLKEFLLPHSFNKFQSRNIEKVYKNCSKIIATSTALKEEISNKFPFHKNKIAIIPNPVDENIFLLKPEGVINNSITIICIALFRPEKRIDIIISAIYNLIKSGANLTLKIIGDGPLKLVIEKQIKSLGIIDNVQLLGYMNQSEIVRELHLSDLFVLSSEIETFGIALIEAQMCGLPAVCTDCGGPRDIITQETGILVEPRSIKSLTDGIKKTINNLHQYKAKKIRKKTISQFGVKAYTDAISEISQSIIEFSL